MNVNVLDLAKKPIFINSPLTDVDRHRRIITLYKMCTRLVKNIVHSDKNQIYNS